MAASYMDIRVFNEKLMPLVEKLRKYPMYHSNISYVGEFPSGSGCIMRFKGGVTLTSWGEDITVTLTPTGPNTTQVQVYSVCALPTQVVDWGVNRQNVNNIMIALTVF